MKVVCSSEKCTGCLACVVTCLDQHYPADAHSALSPRRYEKRVLPSGYTRYETFSCRHCQDAPCISACPVGAIRRDEQGWTRVDRARCIGCRMCLNACPYDIPRIDGERKMVKCDGCGGDPACVAVCPNGALSIEK